MGELQVREVSKKEEGDRKKELESLDKEIRDKNSGVKVFHVEIPHVGDFFIRAQMLSDTKVAATAAMKLAEDILTKAGGREEMMKQSRDEQDKLNAEIDNEVLEQTNEIGLKRCVIYPYDFTDKIEKGEVPYGVIPVLLDKITEISGWVETEIREI